MADFSAEIVDFGTEQAKRAQPAPLATPQNPPATVPASPAASPFDDAIASYAPAQHQAATGNIIGATGSSPDAAGKALTLAPQVGVPAGVVEGDLPGFEARHRISRNAAIAGGNPRMADWLAGDPMHARVSLDDFDHLDTLGKITKALGDGWTTAVQSNERGRLGAEAALGAANEPQVAKVERDLAAHPVLGGIWGKLQTVGGFAGGLTDNFMRGLWIGVQGASVGAVAGGAATAGTGPGVIPGAAAGSLAGFGVGTGAGFKYDMAKAAAGNTYLDLAETVGQDGKPVAPAARDAAALLVGMGTYALAGVGTKAVAKPAVDAAAKLLADAVKEGVTRPTVARALVNFGGQLAKAGIQGTALNAAMEGTSIFGEELGKQLSGGANFETVFNDPVQRQQAVDHLITAATDGAMLFPLVHLPLAARSLVGDTMRARQSMTDVANFQELETGAAENKTRQRSLSAFQSFMQHQTGGTPVDNLSITGEAIRTLYQSAGREPGPGDGLLGDVVPGLKEQMQQADATGGDIVVPTAAYVAHLAGTPISEALRADIRFRPDGMTMKEAEAYEKERGTHLADLATQGQASLDAAHVAAEPGRQVFEDIRGKLRAAGTAADVAEQYAALVASRYEARADRFAGAKGTALDLYRAEGLDVQRQTPESLRRVQADDSDLVINALRNDTRKAPGARELFGPSLHEAVKAAGGIIDTGGELKAMDLDKAKTRGLIRKPTGDAKDDIEHSMDAMALRMWEMGYFPDKLERPSEQDLIDAMQRGDEHYSEGAGNERKAAFEEAVADLDEFVNRQGIDVKKASNEEIKAAIKKALADEEAQGGRSLAQGERGRISLDNGRATITLFKDADLSTFLHETGHLWLDELGRDALDAAAPEGLRADWSAVKKWLGASVEPMTEKQFNSEYVQHIDIRGRDGSAIKNREAIQRDGFKAAGNVNALPPSRTGEPTNVVDAKFRPRAGDMVYLAPKGAWKDAPNGPQINAGWKPKPHEVVVISDPSKSMYENYVEGINKSEPVLSTEQHETFARGFETYLMEGRAPSGALASAFRKFKSWLVRIYKSAAGLGVPINDEIRGVFDRMVASEEQINSWRQAQALRPVFADAKSAGMTDAEFTAYSKAIEKSRNAADEKLTAKVMEAVRRERTAEWKAEAATVREEVAPQIRGRRDLKAQYFLRTGKMLDDPEATPAVEHVRLSRDALDDMYGTDEASKALPSGIISAKGGAHPDEVADLFGYRSGDEMVRDLMSLEASRKQAEESTGEKLDGQKYVRKLIDDRVRETMLDRHGDALNYGTIEEEALAAVHNVAQADVMSMEARAIARQAGVTALRLEDIRHWADGQIAEMNVERGTDVRQFSRQEAKAGRDVERALLKGDHAAAFEAKQRQLINHVLATKAQEASDDYDGARKMFSRYAAKPTFKNMEQEYTDRVHEILKRIGYSTKRSDEELAAGIKSSLAQFTAEKLSMGEEFVMADFLLDPVWRKDAVGDMTTEEMRGVSDTVKSLAHVARSLHSVLDEGKRQELNELVSEAVEKMSTMKQRPIPAEINPGTGPGIQGVLQRLSSLMRKADAALLKQEQVFDWLDGRDPNGVFNRVVFRRLKDAQHRENDMLREVNGKVREIGAAMSKEWSRTLDNRVAVDELPDQRTGKPFIFRRKDLLALALNIGNDGNFEKLSRGYGWDRDAIKSVLDTHLKKEDWDFVQGIWDTFEHLYPDIEAMTRRVTGVGPEKVVATPVETAHGTYRGGYYPVVYDPLKSHREELRSQKAGADMFENNYFRATTPKGHTLARTDYSAPIRLSLDVIPWKLGQAVHDLAFREAVIDADKFLTQKGIREGVDGVLGHEYTLQFRKWLQSIANDRNIDDKGLAGMDWLARQARINTTVVGIGFRVSTMLKHGSTALSNSVGEVGGKWMLQGTREVYGSPSQMREKWDYALSRSGELRHRMNSIDRDVREGLRTLQGQTGVIAAAERYSHYGVAMLDMGSAVPTWFGAYRKALSDGASDADAVYAADKSVRNAHGGQGVTDIAQIQRGGEIAKLFTMFYGFFNHIYNRQRDTVRIAGEGVGKVKGGDYAGARRDFAMVLARSMYYVMIPAFVEALVSKGAPDDDKDETWGGWAGKAILGEIPAGIPIVRDIAKRVIDGKPYTMSPVAQAVTTAAGSADDLAAFTGLREDKEPSKRWLEHAINTAGYVFGLPTGQVAGTTQYLWDVLDGDEQPEDTQDFIHGLMYGRKKGH